MTNLRVEQNHVMQVGDGREKKRQEVFHLFFSWVHTVFWLAGLSSISITTLRYNQR